MQDSSHTDLDRLGLDPSQPFYDLNLAGSQGVPAPDKLAQHAMASTIAPDFAAPDFQVPVLQSHDFAYPSISHLSDFDADPSLPDLRSFQVPYSVTLVNQEGVVPDPRLAADVPSPEEIAASLYPGLGFQQLEVRHGVADADPPLPDLQHPELTQQVQMSPDERPGELAPSALEVLHASRDYQQGIEQHYPSSQMDQRGVNSWRGRHQDLLKYGLEEH